MPLLTPPPTAPRNFPAAPAGAGKSGTRFRSRQRSLFCPCGEAMPAIAGFCSSCHRRERRSRAYFGGNRERALESDAWQCRVCGEADPLHVHHRRAGDHQTLITLCAACHARVHRTVSLRRWMPEFLLALWREWHPGVPEQLQLPLPPPPGDNPPSSIAPFSG